MARNYVQEGCVVDWTNNSGGAVTSGAPVVIGYSRMGIALVDIASNAVGSVQVEGVFTLAKASGTITQGQKLWWDAANAEIVNAPAKNAYFIGYAFRGAATGDATVDVELEEFAAEGPRLLTLAATGNDTLNVGDFAGGDLTLLAPNAAAKTVNLPGVATIPPNARLTVRKTTADAFAITLDPNSTEQIAGGATHAAIDANNDYAVFQNTGSAWALVDSAIA
jgi:predicted RecA/RadA family phage recombinase